MLASYHENDPRTLAVLSTALRSRSRATRLRAVAMLSRVDCQQRTLWLETALGDHDRAVRETAGLVLAWLAPPPVSTSARDVTLERGRVLASEVSGRDPDNDVDGALLAARGYEWEYTVEVWRVDGLQLGVYFMSTCQEDDRHARSIALGQAILANAGMHGDAFDPEHAATFIIDKRRSPRGTTRR